MSVAPCYNVQVAHHLTYDMPTAYTYIRFSSEKQKFGHSETRQLERANKYAHTNGLILDTSTYKDLGVSAFRSKNYIEGSLGAFIEAVDAGIITKGSYLLVESLDRLSRDTVDVALELFLGIIRRGIIIVTLMEPPEVFSQAHIRDNPTKLLVALVTMWRANEESATKSDRAYRKFHARVAEGKLPTTRLPSWMAFEDNGKRAVLVLERAAVIKRIFTMAIKGEGARGIARILNAEKVPALASAYDDDEKEINARREWYQSTVSTVLRNPATYGCFKGTEGVFPCAVTKEIFQRAQTVVDARKLFKGIATSRNPNNIFAGLARCGHCGRAMRFTPRRGAWYMRCRGANDFKVCPGRLFPFAAAETDRRHAQ
jgi:DNA invertase Pin-like site-specific DNA recombinase